MGSQPGTSGLSRQHSLSRGAKLVHLSLSRANSNESDSSLLYEEVCQVNTHAMPDGRVVTETSTTVVVEDNTQVNYLDMLVYSSQLSYGFFIRQMLFQPLILKAMTRYNLL
jgi:hypothetical protein